MYAILVRVHVYMNIYVIVLFAVGLAVTNKTSQSPGAGFCTELRVAQEEGIGQLVNVCSNLDSMPSQSANTHSPEEHGKSARIQAVRISRAFASGSKTDW